MRVEEVCLFELVQGTCIPAAGLGGIHKHYIYDRPVVVMIDVF